MAVRQGFDALSDDTVLDIPAPDTPASRELGVRWRPARAMPPLVLENAARRFP